MSDFNFDVLVARKGSDSYKWDLQPKQSNIYDEDFLPMAVADMDFKIPEFIKKGILKRLENDSLGYFSLSDYKKIVRDWILSQYKYEVEEDSIICSHGIITAISILLSILVKEDDKVLIQTPVYVNFFNVLKKHKCQIIENELIYEDNTYHVDFEAFEEQLANGVKIFVLCNPQNPVGRVWKEEELRKMGDLCKKYGVLIISDEIHADLIHESKHIPIASLFDKSELEVISCYSPSKTFNMPSLFMSNIVIPNIAIRKQFLKIFSVTPNVFSYDAMKSAYQEGEEWMHEMNDYIYQNYKYLKNNISEKVQITVLEGTYLAWLDCKAISDNADEVMSFFTDKCKIVVSDGRIFGDSGRCFVRMNLACPRQIVEKAVRRINENL